MAQSDMEIAKAELSAATQTPIMGGEAIASHNRGMLQKFYLQQLSNLGTPSPLLLQLIDRDFGSWSDFRMTCFEAAEQAKGGWVILGLCFADFKFHLFATSAQMPFCVSPMMCFPANELGTSQGNTELGTGSGFDRINWAVVSARIECLQEPLELIADPIDCSSDSGCELETVNE